jgi:hypothetical protein
MLLERRELDAIPEQFLEVLLRTPQRWRRGPRRRRRRERLHRCEQIAEHAFGCPTQQRDLPARSAHAHQLVGCSLVMRCEHHADRGHDDVEVLVGERQVLGVALDPLELQPHRLGALLAGLEQTRCQITRDDGCPPLCRRDGSVAGAGSDIEYAVALGDPRCLDEGRAERQQERLDHLGIVARRPHRAVLGLQLLIGCHRHLRTPST